MADTEPQRGSGVPWWAPLLALAALVAGVAAAGVLSSHGRDRTHAVLGTSATLTATTAATTAATTTATTTAAKVERSLLGHTAGRYVRAHAVRVTAVVGERTFWVRARTGERLLVHQQGRGTRWAVRRGQLLTFTGVVKKNRPQFPHAGYHLEVFGPRIRFDRR